MNKFNKFITNIVICVMFFSIACYLVGNWDLRSILIILGLGAFVIILGMKLNP